MQSKKSSAHRWARPNAKPSGRYLRQTQTRWWLGLLRLMPEGYPFLGRTIRFIMDSERIVFWNARGVNSRAPQNVVANLVVSERISILCIQETKLGVVDDQLILSIIGPSFDYHFVPAVETRGGILDAWHRDKWAASNVHSTTRTLTLKISSRAAASLAPWWLTTVYGPHCESERPAFLQELRGVRACRIGPWLVGGDFNLIYKAKDKNNDRLNRRLMGMFRRFLQEMELAELHLTGRLYTWSNERSHPTLERIDRVFACIPWCDLFPHHHLCALSSACSDHAPLLLNTNISTPFKKRFIFENIWPKMPGYLEAV
jgi:exonuclease III